MNTAIRLYADAANAKTKFENGFELSDYDNRVIAFARDYAESLLAIDISLDINAMLDKAWQLFRKYFTLFETGIKKDLLDKYWDTD
jgi:V/A-type H+-transporting ATPase subunit B